MLKRIFVAIAMAIGIAATGVAPSHAMSISSAARSISASMPVRTIEFGERSNSVVIVTSIGKATFGYGQAVVMKRRDTGSGLVALETSRLFD